MSAVPKQVPSSVGSTIAEVTHSTDELSTLYSTFLLTLQVYKGKSKGSERSVDGDRCRCVARIDGLRQIGSGRVVRCTKEVRLGGKSRAGSAIRQVVLVCTFL